jgi:hypothetical protein
MWVTHFGANGEEWLTIGGCPRWRTLAEGRLWLQAEGAAEGSGWRHSKEQYAGEVLGDAVADLEVDQSGTSPVVASGRLERTAPGLEEGPGSVTAHGRRRGRTSARCSTHRWWCSGLTHGRRPVVGRHRAAVQCPQWGNGE